MQSAAASQLLLIHVHPAPHASRANAAMLARARGVPGVTVHDLYACYPDFFIDAAREHRLLERHATVIVQHPFYWHSAPALFKEWQDTVLSYGWAYGAGASRLRGKRWGHALTAGWPQAAYAPQGEKRYTVSELLRPLEQTATTCGMHWLEPFVIHHARAIADDVLAAEVDRYVAWLGALVDRPAEPA